MTRWKAPTLAATLIVLERDRALSDRRRAPVVAQTGARAADHPPAHLDDVARHPRGQGRPCTS